MQYCVDVEIWLWGWALLWFSLKWLRKCGVSLHRHEDAICIRKNSVTSLLTTLPIPNVWVLPIPANYLTPAGYPTIQVSSDTIFLEGVSGSASYVPWDCLPAPDAHHSASCFLGFWLLTYKSVFPGPPKFLIELRKTLVFTSLLHSKGYNKG